MPPNIKSAVAQSTNAIKVTWTKPSNSQGEPKTYTIIVKDQTTKEQKNYTIYDPAVESFDIGELDAFTLYDITMVTENSAEDIEGKPCGGGVGVESDLLTVQTWPLSKSNFTTFVLSQGLKKLFMVPAVAEP